MYFIEWFDHEGNRKSIVAESWIERDSIVDELLMYKMDHKVTVL
ncbi:hypothetical protein [Metabacillus arenae]|nr:hypothetical protein [Metabacillus arenae]